MKIKTPDALLAAEANRHGLVKITAVGDPALASDTLALPFTQLAHTADVPALIDEKVIWSVYTVNCDSHCPLHIHMVDGAIKYIKTDDTGNDNCDSSHQVHARLRRCSIRRRVYSPDRLKCPMKRIGKRGEGKFEQIS